MVISRDHHDVSGTDSPFRETSNIKDGSAFTAGEEKKTLFSLIQKKKFSFFRGKEVRRFRRGQFCTLLLWAFGARSFRLGRPKKKGGKIKEKVLFGEGIVLPPFSFFFFRQ